MVSLGLAERASERRARLDERDTTDDRLGLHRINHHLPFLSPSYPSSIRLPSHDLTPSSFSLRHPTGSPDSDSDSSSSDDGLPTTRSHVVGGVDTSDELPLPYRRQGAWGVVSSASSEAMKLASSAWEGLGWGGDRARGYRTEGERDDGIARAFWGTRRADRTGGIRLGEAGGGRRGGAAGGGGLSGFSGLMERVTDVAGSRRPPPPPAGAGYSSLPSHAPPPPRRAPPSPSSRSHSRAASISSSNGAGALFELGEEDEEGHADAVELPREFELKERAVEG
ncbi:hypothetical protein BCR35DRAFT_304768 [Leucosporidium creatinivorum]|uniref:Uncharacterized protein n=1 Tax=Leucosporidium creatinivorum TaxID=106004 RepID=A0A1Y2F7N0_9BASI|nr:hypothetical protein BCR35DRAFT_304768 [Leucosporidium creatinivorum]